MTELHDRGDCCSYKSTRTLKRLLDKMLGMRDALYMLEREGHESWYIYGKIDILEKLIEWTEEEVAS